MQILFLWDSQEAADRELANQIVMDGSTDPDERRARSTPPPARGSSGSSSISDSNASPRNGHHGGSRVWIAI